MYDISNMARLKRYCGSYLLEIDNGHIKEYCGSYKYELSGSNVRRYCGNFVL